MVPLKAEGRFGVRVEEAEKFLIKAVGTARYLTAVEIWQQFQGPLIAKTKSLLLQGMQGQHVGIKVISAYLEALSQLLRPPFAEFWLDLGLALEAFYMTAVDVDTTHPAGAAIVKAMGQQSAQAIAGYSFQQGQLLEIAGKAAESGTGGGLLGALMMTNMLGGGMAPLLQPQPTAGTQPPLGPVPGSPGPQLPAGPRDVFCARCSRRFASAMSCCPQCGKPYNPCPRCRADNEPTAARCVSCGGGLTAASLCACGAQVTPGTAFCPCCGRPAAAPSGCPKCGFQTGRGDAFCGRCGFRLQGQR
jgi:membrane protease subunit (stomatin/prohibitin family)